MDPRGQFALPASVETVERATLAQADVRRIAPWRQNNSALN
jgi:hypothetical protein